MGLDGVNPFFNQSLSHYSWRVVLLNFNLPPWLVTKHLFFILSLIIPTKENVTSKNIDVYLALLIEELLQLWEGMKAVDVSMGGENSKFILCAILMWCINDFPACGMLTHQETKGYKGCPPCGPNVTTRRSKALGKNVYLGHRCYLSWNHPYRQQKQAFDGSKEHRRPPHVTNARDIL